MQNSHHNTPPLTKNQTLVMSALEQATGPLSAYKILDQLRDDGFRAPLQVYRALEKLLEIGVVHRIESLNSFVACRHPSCDSHEIIAFTICEDCEAVAEFSDGNLSKNLKNIAVNSGFLPKQSTVELRGQCKDCRTDKAN